MAARFLRANVIVAVVFLCRAFIITVFAGYVLIGIAFIGAKANISKIGVFFINAKLNAKAGEVFNAVGQLIRNFSSQLVARRFVGQLKKRHRAYAISRNAALKFIVALALFAGEDTGLAGI